MRLNIARIAIIAVSLFPISSKAQDTYLDSSFGTNGVILAPPFAPAAMAIQEDGKILLTGSRVPGGDNSKIYRFNADGTPDMDFGDQGAAPAGNSTSYVGLRQLEDNKILLVGNTRVGPTGANGTIVFAKLNSDGSPDTFFGTNGILQVAAYAQQSDEQDIAGAVKVKFLPDGSIICAGMIGYTFLNPLANGPMYITRLGPMVTKFKPDFTLDTTFKGTGYLKLPYTTAPRFTALDILEDGSIIAGLARSGPPEVGGGDIKLYKYMPNGNLSTAFGTGGIKTIDAGSIDDRIADIKVMANGKIFITGSKRNGNGRDAFIARLTATGTLDESYGSGGMLVFQNDSGYAENAVQSLVLENGNIVSGLQRWNFGNSSYDFALLGTDSNGSLLNSFGEDGQVMAALDQDQLLTCLIMQPDGKVVAAGNNADNMVLMRYDISGALKTPSFDDSDIKIYPNPATDRINVAGLPEGTLIAICNISGQKLLEVTANGDMAIDISGLLKGIYFLNTAKGSAKIIKK